MTMRLEYRSARPNDIAECVTLRGLTRENAISASRLADLGITVESWSESVRIKSLPGFVCLSDHKIVGYCFGDRHSGEVVVLALLPEYEHRGIGRSLLAQTIDCLCQFGHCRLYLGCSTDPESRSYGFYRHLGWRSTNQLDDNGDEILELQLAVDRKA
jgi:GNAT superfamily N-acetyltransferase